jgi:hypothetical protein
MKGRPSPGGPSFKFRRRAEAARAVLVLRNQQNRSIFLFLPHFRTQNRFTLLLEML